MKRNAAFASFRLSLTAKFVVGTCLILVIALGISFYLITQRQDRLIMSQAEGDARIVFNQIVITRSWIADHGGVFIQRLPWMSPSPYLEEPELIDMQGKRYVKKSPAMVTKDLSEYAKDKGLFWFHITSLRLINPENAPDAFERQALLDFENNSAHEKFSMESIERASYLRYIAPLRIEEGCMQCHEHQGYRVGDVKGAISVMIPVDRTLELVRENRRSMLMSALLIIASLGAVMFVMTRALVLSPVRKLTRSIRDLAGGNYSPEGIASTGDEIEELSRSVNDMAATLSAYHSALNNRIAAATKDLEETNIRLQEANRLLNEANNRKSDSIARASHEIRTPLTSIRGAMDYLSEKIRSLPPDLLGAAAIEDIRGFLSVIRNNTERIIRLVNDMLDLERIESGVSELRMGPVDFGEVVKETLTYFRAAAHEKSISMSSDLESSLAVFGNSDRLKQVLINLMANAVKFSGPGSAVLVKAYRDGNDVVAEVGDEGPGIPPEDRDKVFEKFYKKGPCEGAGLGLAICKTIIESHGGSISALSGEGKGSIFRIRIPSAGQQG